MGRTRDHALLEKNSALSWHSSEHAVTMVSRLPRTRQCPGQSANTNNRYVRTSILSEETWTHIKKSGVQFATVEDAGQALLRLLSDQTIQGRTFFISARKWASSGYVDFDVDDYRDDLLREVQTAQMLASPPDAGLFVDKSGQHRK